MRVHFPSSGWRNRKIMAFRRETHEFVIFDRHSVEVERRRLSGFIKRKGKRVSAREAERKTAARHTRGARWPFVRNPCNFLPAADRVVGLVFQV